MDLPLDYTVWKLVLTYPSVVSDLTITKGTNFIKREMKKCFKKFFDSLSKLKVNGKSIVPPDHKMGCYENSHVWSSDNPILPHCHHHVSIPGASVKWPDADFGQLPKVLKSNKIKCDDQLQNMYEDWR